MLRSLLSSSFHLLLMTELPFMAAQGNQLFFLKSILIIITKMNILLYIILGYANCLTLRKNAHRYL